MESANSKMSDDGTSSDSEQDYYEKIAKQILKYPGPFGKDKQSPINSVSVQKVDI
jgi:hypothetical protein